MHLSNPCKLLAKTLGKYEDAWNSCISSPLTALYSTHHLPHNIWYYVGCHVAMPRTDLTIRLFARGVKWSIDHFLSMRLSLHVSLLLNSLLLWMIPLGSQHVVVWNRADGLKAATYPPWQPVIDDEWRLALMKGLNASLHNSPRCEYAAVFSHETSLSLPAASLFNFCYLLQPSHL